MGVRSIKFQTDHYAREPQRVSARAPRKRNLVARSRSQQGENNEPRARMRGESDKSRPQASTSESLTESEANCNRKDSIYQLMAPAPDEN